MKTGKFAESNSNKLKILMIIPCTLPKYFIEEFEIVIHRPMTFWKSFMKTGKFAEPNSNKLKTVCFVFRIIAIAILKI